MDMIDATKETSANLQEYDIIGFASGIDFGKFYLEIENFARQKLPFQKEVFFLYTCAMERDGFTDVIKEIALEKDAVILGEYGCKGYNTYGPWKLIGGMNKSHPTIDASVKSMWYRFSRREDDYCIECSDDGVIFKQMRVCHMWNGAGTIQFGIYACSPENSSFKAIFTNMEITECKWLSHNGQQPDTEL